jgi:23S rRNA pseudouridine2605 synthase
MKKRLQTILAHAGIASRRGAITLIESGKVSVDGSVVREKGFRADPEESDIRVEGRALAGDEKKYYFLFNKPENVISTAIDTHGREKVTDFFSDVDARLYPVGRLDKDTTGLLILTNDGDLAHKLTHPRFEVEKEYSALIDDKISPEGIKRIQTGVKVEGKMTTPCEVEYVKKTSEGYLYRIRIHEGMKRQIRRMFFEVGGKVLRLKRLKFAGLSLRGVHEGQRRDLTDKEIERLKAL